MRRTTLEDPCTGEVVASALRRFVCWTRCITVVGAAACVLAVSACTGGSDSGAAPTESNVPSVLTGPPLTVEPSPAPTRSREKAEASAQEAIENYLAMFAEISADPNRDVAELEQVARGRALDWVTHQITGWRDAGQTGVGAQVASELIVTAVDLDPSDNAAPYPSVDVTACVDLSGTDLVDEDGNSVVPGDRPDQVLVDYVIQDVGWPGDQQWRVIGDDDQLTDTDPPEFVPCP